MEGRAATTQRHLPLLADAGARCCNARVRGAPDRIRRRELGKRCAQHGASSDSAAQPFDGPPARPCPSRPQIHQHHALARRRESPQKTIRRDASHRHPVPVLPVPFHQIPRPICPRVCAVAPPPLPVRRLPVREGEPPREQRQGGEPRVRRRLWSAALWRRGGERESKRRRVHVLVRRVLRGRVRGGVRGVGGPGPRVHRRLVPRLRPGPVRLGQLCAAPVQQLFGKGAAAPVGPRAFGQLRDLGHRVGEPRGPRSAGRAKAADIELSEVRSSCLESGVDSSRVVRHLPLWLGRRS
ncbi:hypothetical protein DFJ74DRAFT_668815 [Hyaloraphidium curvatum]|nr:hypothetical protein DFJ74DRAFT_668815 [Hyaloraphidium curvatum]